MSARGLRNNNPMNIDRNATRWQGMADDQSGDPRFVVFKTAQWGIRAGARLLLTYANQYGLHTVRGLINRWAPPVENDTSAYVVAVTDSMKAAGLAQTADDEIAVDSCAVMLCLVKAIITHENGQNPYPDSLILEGLHLAGVSDVKPKPLVKQNTFQAQIGAGVAVVGAGATQAAQYAPTVKGWADQLSSYVGSPIIQHVSTVLITVAGGLTVLGIAASILKQRAS